jgi:AmmeMemoRadiSam system protein A
MCPQPDNRSGAAACAAADVDQPAQYSQQERKFLVRLAHEAINSALEQRAAIIGDVVEYLKEARGAFTTLYLDSEVRGCVGFVCPTAPLFQTVFETARAAAFQDVRFVPVTREETARLTVSISVLSPLNPIKPEEIVLGRHGLLVTSGNYRGLLLPQVPLEHGWDLKAFLQQTCRKAGLPLNAWQRGATLEGFTAEVFGERE